MMTLRRFRALVASYGSDLRRWPAETRGEVTMLATISAEVRSVLTEERELDEALESLHRMEDAALWPQHEQQAALARLRSGVGARITATASQPPHRVAGINWSSVAGPVGVLHAPLRLLGLAASGSIAVAIGIVIGSMSGAGGAPDAVQTLLQASPIHLFPF